MMATFLTNLFNRTKESAGVLRPRPVSLYEPAAPVGVLGGFEAHTEHPVPLPSAGELTRTLPTARTTATTPRAAPTPQAERRVHATPAPSPATAPVPGAIASNRTILVPPPQPAALISRPSQVTLTPSDNPSPIIHETGATKADRGELRNEQTSALVSETRPASVPALTRIAQRASTSRVARSESTTDSTPQAKHMTPISPRQRLSGVRQRPPDATPSEPTINITIGRVEVTAAPSPPPRERRKGPDRPPVMSLDDYLRRREKEGRQ